ncbi:MAG: DUF2232 domain-containing protein [Bacteriovoracia bacterium]
MTEQLAPTSLHSAPSGSGKTLFKLAVAVPFFLGSALYLSIIFAILSAMPMIYAHLRFGRLYGVLCSVTNIAIVWALSGRENAAIFFVLGVVPAATIAESFRLKLKLEWNVVATIGMMLLVSTTLLLSYSHKFKINPIEKLDSFVGDVVAQVAENIEKYKASSAISSQELEKFLVDPEMTKKNILYELPSAVTIFLLIVVASNLLLSLRFNLNNVRTYLGLEEDFFKKWKAPDHLVWPTLAVGFCVVVEIPGVSEIALNLFKVFMAIYAIQGLAITHYVFDLWGVKGFLRPIGYAVAVAVLLPLVISLGFFDLWFNFREKLKV